MDREIVLNWCVFAAIFIISYSKESKSFPHSLGSSQINWKISQATKLMNQPSMSEILKSRERRNFEMTLSRTPREVHTNGRHITTSNDIPKGRYKLQENNHGVVLSGRLPKRSNNDLDPDGLRNTIERGRVNFSELGENHGTVLKIPEYTEDRIFEDELELSVIPLKQQVTTDTNSDSF